MKKYFLNLLWLLTDRAFMLIFQVMLFASIKRSYSIEVLGAWSTINNLSQILLSIFLLGIDVVIIKRIIENENRARYEIGSAIIVQLIGLTIYMISLIFVTINFYSQIPNSLYYCIILIAGNFFSVLTKAVFWHYTALLESKYRAYTIIISSSVALLFLTYTLYYNHSYVFISFFVFYLSQFIISLFIYFFFFKKSVVWSVDKDLVELYFKIGSKLIISTLSVALFVQADLLMLEKLSGLEETGFFSAALRISTIWFMIAGILAGAFYPKIISVKKDLADSYKLMEVMTSFATLLAVVAALTISLLGSYIVNLVYGSGMDKSAIILQIHIWSGIFIFMGAFSSKWLYANELINFDIAKTLLAATFNVLLNLLVIPKYGAVGAAWVSFLSYFIANYLFFALSYKTRKIFYIKSKAILNVFNFRKMYDFIGDAKCLFRS